MYSKRVFACVLGLLVVLVVGWLVGCSQQSASVVEVVEAGAPSPFRREADESITSDETRSLRLRLTKHGATFERKGLTGQLTTTSVGRGEAQLPHEGLTAISGARAELTRVRDGVVESYELRTNGIEQIFQIAERPAGDGPLVVRIAVDGLVVSDSRSPGTLDLKKPLDDGAALRYGEVSAKDATGRALDCQLARDGENGIRIQVADASAAYPVVIDPLVWGLRSRLTALGEKALDGFSAYALSISGDTIFVGNALANAFEGDVVIFRRGPNGWAEDSRIERAYDSNQTFGISGTLASENLAFIGSTGPAFVYRKQGTQWQLVQGLPTGEADLGVSNFAPNPIGYVDGTVGLLHPGTRAADGTFDGGIPSSLETFGIDGGVWIVTGKTILPDRIAVTNGGGFAMTDTRVAIGTGNKVLVYTRQPSGALTMQASISAPPIPGSNAFGTSLALSGTTLLVGNPAERAAYFYLWTGNDWILQTRIAGPPAPAVGAFGYAVALVDDTGWISDPSDALGGTVYRYRRSGAVWILDEEVPSPGTHTSLFGAYMTATSTTALFSASGEQAGAGAAYVYELRNGLGDPCTKDETCASNQCVDGVCCDSACGNNDPTRCSVCNGAEAGTCKPAQPGVACRSAAGSCDRAEVCDGIRTSCPRDSIIADGTACQGGACLGGACVASEAAPPLATLQVSRLDAGGCSASSGSRPDDGALLLMSGTAIGLLLLRRKSRARPFLIGASLAVGVSGTSGSPVCERAAATLRSAGLEAALWPTASTITDLSTGGSWTFASSAMGSRAASAEARFDDLHAGPGRIERRSADLVEWFSTAENGIEHGFDVLRPLGTTGELTLRIEMAPGASLTLAGGGSAFDAATGLAYGALEAHDALGRTLPSELVAHDNVIELRVRDVGARYPVVIDPLIWRRRQQLKSPITGLPPRAYSGFGGVISLDGDRALVSDGRGVGPYGSALMVHRTGNDWSIESILTPPFIEDAPTINGVPVALSGAHALVGAISGSGLGPSFVYAWERLGNTWSYEGGVASPTPVLSQGFGSTLAVSGDDLAVGAPYEGANADGSSGTAIGVDGIAQGAVYLYHRSATGWVFQSKLTGKVPIAAHQFGASLSMKGGTLIVGATGGGNSNLPIEVQVPDTVWFFDRVVTGWSLVGLEQTPPAVTAFGSSVATDGQVTVVGGPRALTYFSLPSDVGGTAIVYERAGTGWSFVQTLSAPDQSRADRFGTGVAVDGTQIVVGAPDAADARGEAYLFERQDAGVWTPASDFSAVGDTIDDQYGFAVAIQGDTAMVGVPAIGTLEVVYHGTEGNPCTTGESCASGQCIDGVCCSSRCGDGDPNDCVACSVATGASRDGICEVVAPRVCRPAKGPCDVEELCNGVDVSCPADDVASNGLGCAGGSCSAGQCQPAAPPSLIDAGPADDVSHLDTGCSAARSTGNSSSPPFFALGAAIGLVALYRSRR